MKKSKIDGFNNFSDVFKDNTNHIEELINLRLEMPDKLIMNFDGKPNETASKEIEHILRDDDSDLLYWNK
jgi:hypothetical protein